MIFSIFSCLFFKEVWCAYAHNRPEALRCWELQFERNSKQMFYPPVGVVQIHNLAGMHTLQTSTSKMIGASLSSCIQNDCSDLFLEFCRAGCWRARVFRRPEVLWWRKLYFQGLRSTSRHTAQASGESCIVWQVFMHTPDSHAMTEATRAWSKWTKHTCLRLFHHCWKSLHAHSCDLKYNLGEDASVMMVMMMILEATFNPMSL